MNNYDIYNIIINEQVKYLNYLLKHKLENEDLISDIDKFKNNKEDILVEIDNLFNGNNVNLPNVIPEYLLDKREISNILNFDAWKNIVDNISQYENFNGFDLLDNLLSFLDDNNSKLNKNQCLDLICNTLLKLDFSECNNDVIMVMTQLCNLNNDKVNQCLNTITNNNYEFLFNENVIDDDLDFTNDFFYLLNKEENKKYKDYFCNNKSINRKINSNSIKQYTFDNDFLNIYPIEKFSFLLLHKENEAFTNNSKFKSFFEGINNISKNLYEKYSCDCCNILMEEYKNKYISYFDNSDRNKLKQQFVRLHRNKEEGVTAPYETNQFHLPDKPKLSSGTWASTKSENENFISKWDEWQKSEMELDYKYVTTFNIDEEFSKYLYIKNKNDICKLFFLFPKEYNYSLEDLVSIALCADEKLKNPYNLIFINWDELLKQYDVIHFGDENDIGSGFSLSSSYDTETILVTNPDLINNVYTYNIESYKNRNNVYEDIVR